MAELLWEYGISTKHPFEKHLDDNYGDKIKCIDSGYIVKTKSDNFVPVFISLDDILDHDQEFQNRKNDAENKTNIRKEIVETEALDDEYLFLWDELLTAVAGADVANMVGYVSGNVAMNEALSVQQTHEANLMLMREKFTKQLHKIHETTHFNALEKHKTQITEKRFAEKQRQRRLTQKLNHTSVINQVKVYQLVKDIEEAREEVFYLEHDKERMLYMADTYRQMIVNMMMQEELPLKSEFDRIEAEITRLRKAASDSDVDIFEVNRKLKLIMLDLEKTKRDIDAKQDPPITVKQRRPTTANTRGLRLSRMQSQNSRSIAHKKSFVSTKPSTFQSRKSIRSSTRINRVILTDGFEELSTKNAVSVSDTLKPNRVSFRLPDKPAHAINTTTSNNSRVNRHKSVADIIFNRLSISRESVRLGYGGDYDDNSTDGVCIQTETDKQIAEIYSHRGNYEKLKVKVLHERYQREKEIERLKVEQQAKKKKLITCSRGFTHLLDGCPHCIMIKSLYEGDEILNVIEKNSPESLINHHPRSGTSVLLGNSSSNNRKNESNRNDTISPKINETRLKKSFVSHSTTSIREKLRNLKTAKSSKRKLSSASITSVTETNHLDSNHGFNISVRTLSDYLSDNKSVSTNSSSTNENQQYIMIERENSYDDVRAIVTQTNKKRCSNRLSRGKDNRTRIPLSSRPISFRQKERRDSELIK